MAPKVYDFPLAKVEDQLVSFLKQKRGESTVADMIAGTGLPKYQVEQAAKAALDEYAGRLKVTESGELLYYFPDGMRSTAARRRARAAAVLEVVRAHRRPGASPSCSRSGSSPCSSATSSASWPSGCSPSSLSVAASVAGRGDGRGSGRGRGGGFGGMYLVMQLFDLILRMWFWSSILTALGGGSSSRERPGRSTSRCSGSSSGTGTRTRDGRRRSESTSYPTSAPTRA